VPGADGVVTLLVLAVILVVVVTLVLFVSGRRSSS
jgi:hypothetical protein